VVPSRSVRNLFGGFTEVTMNANLPSRTLWPMVAVAVVSLATLSIFDSRALVVRSKIPGSLPPVLIMIIRKRSVTARGRLKRFLLSQERVALLCTFCAVACSAPSAGARAVPSSGDTFPGDGVVC